MGLLDEFPIPSCKMKFHSRRQLFWTLHCGSLILLATLPGMGQTKAPLQETLDTLLVPRIEFVETPLKDAITYLSDLSQTLDRSGNQGINLLLKDPELGNRTVTLQLSRVSLAEALRFTALLAGARLRVEKVAVVIEPIPPDEGIPTPRDNPALGTKLQQLVIPSLEFSDTPLVDAIHFFRAKAGELDIRSPEASRGLNIVLLSPEKAKDARVTLRLKNIPLEEALRYTTTLAGWRHQIDGPIILIRPQNTLD